MVVGRNFPIVSCLVLILLLLNFLLYFGLHDVRFSIYWDKKSPKVAESYNDYLALVRDGNKQLEKDLKGKKFKEFLNVIGKSPEEEDKKYNLSIIVITAV
eukprot:Awhi_evm1s9477